MFISHYDQIVKGMVSRRALEMNGYYNIIIIRIELSFESTPIKGSKSVRVCVCVQIGFKDICLVRHTDMVELVTSQACTD